MDLQMLAFQYQGVSYCTGKGCSKFYSRRIIKSEEEIRGVFDDN